MATSSIDAAAMDSRDVHTIVEDFFPNYGYGDELAEIAQGDNDTLFVSWRDVHQWKPKQNTKQDFPELILDDPEFARLHFENAVAEFDLPTPIPDDTGVRFYELPEYAQKELHELSADDTERLRTVTGSIEQVTKAVEKPIEVAFECLHDCPGIEYITQPEFGEVQEPPKCESCERNGPYDIDERRSTYVDEVRVQLKQPASAAPDNSGQSIMVIVRGDNLTINGNHLQTYVGSHASITGRIKRREGEFKGTKERFVVADHIDVDDLAKQPVEIEEHRDEFEELANSEDPLSLWTESLAPQLHDAWEWDTIKNLAVAYLFASPRIEYDGTIYRGDIHTGVISDPGMAKSLFCRELRQYSPKCMHRTATGISSDVGLTAAAVQDNTFGSGKPTLKPGILVRGNGGHVILEEIDKGPDDLERMNDGLEGDQRITVDKWGLSADLETRVGLFVTGNPVDGHFEPAGNVPEQVDMDHSLLSRFDGLITMEDHADPETDRKIADTIGNSYQEAAEAQHGDREEFEQLDRPISPEVGRAWVGYARESVHPVPTDGALDRLSEWFAEDARQLNEEEHIVPITTRKLETGIRFANAFARLRLSERTTRHHAEQAIKLAKALVGENYDREEEHFDHRRTDGSAPPNSQNEQHEDRRDAITAYIQENAPENGGVPISDVVESVAEETGRSESRIQRDIEKLSQSGTIYNPNQGEVLTT